MSDSDTASVSLTAGQGVLFRAQQRRYQYHRYADAMWLVDVVKVHVYIPKPVLLQTAGIAQA